MAIDTVPEFLLKDEDGDNADADVDPCALSPASESLWPLMSSASENDSFPAVDDIFATFTGISLYYYLFKNRENLFARKIYTMNKQ